MRILSKPLIKDFTLEADDDGNTTIGVRQVTEGENIRRNDIFSKTTRVLEEKDTGDIIKFEQDYNVRKLRRLEAYLSLGYIKGIVDENDSEWFRNSEGPDGPSIRNAMTEREFNAAWDRLPSNVVVEIVNHIHSVNTTWSPSGE